MSKTEAYRFSVLFACSAILNLKEFSVKFTSETRGFWFLKADAYESWLRSLEYFV